MIDTEENIPKSYFAVIPANVRYDEDLTANAKLMYGEITALANQKGYCYASNAYFANLYKVTPQAVSKWISQLVEKEYIKVVFLQTDINTVKERRLYITDVQQDNKRVPLVNRVPKNDIEQVEKVYLTNYNALYQQGLLKMDKPVINWLQSRKMTKDCISKYGLETILKAVTKSKDNKFLISKGYVLTMILSAGMLSQLINFTDGRIDNDSVIGVVDF